MSNKHEELIIQIQYETIKKLRDELEYWNTIYKDVKNKNLEKLCFENNQLKETIGRLESELLFKPCYTNVKHNREEIKPTDAQTAYKVLNNGTGKPNLHKIEKADQDSIHLTPNITLEESSFYRSKVFKDCQDNISNTTYTDTDSIKYTVKVSQTLELSQEAYTYLSDFKNYTLSQNIKVLDDAVANGVISAPEYHYLLGYSESYNH